MAKSLGLTTVQRMRKEFSYRKILKALKKLFRCCNGNNVVQDDDQRYIQDIAYVNKIKESLTDLPLEILTEILARLPLSTIFVARRVCKLFQHLASPHNPRFTALHAVHATNINVFHDLFDRQLILLDPEVDDILPTPGGRRIYKITENHDDEKYCVMNSCRGLFCLLLYKQLKVPNHITEEYAVLMVLNAITNEYAVIPGCDDAKGAWLGFNSSSNQFKVLKLVRSYANKMEAKILDIGTGLCRDIEDPPLLFHDILQPNTDIESRQVSFDSVIYWLIGRYVKNIYFFDFEKEEFGTINLPSELLNKGLECRTWCRMSLGVLEGRLFLCHADHLDLKTTEHYVFWVLTKNEDSQSCWRKAFVIAFESRHNFAHPLSVMRNWEILLYSINSGTVVRCNPKSMSLVKVVDEGLGILCNRVYCLTPSFISLKDSLNVGNNEKIVVHKNRDYRRKLQGKGRSYSMTVREASNMITRVLPSS